MRKKRLNPLYYRAVSSSTTAKKPDKTLVMRNVHHTSTIKNTKL